MTANRFIIIGAGLAGLSAALKIEKQGGQCLILEKTDSVGGKIKTDLFEDNFRLDHGFQVLLPAYPLLQSTTNLLNLNLKYFKAGALVQTTQGRLRVSDPFRNPQYIFETAFSKIGNYADKWLILKLRLQVLNQNPDSILLGPSKTSLQFLREYGFSEKIIENFWRPFFSGIFLDDSLETASSFLLFLYRMFSQSPVAVPALGIGELPKQMVNSLKNSELVFSAEVDSVEPTKVKLKNGTAFSGHIIDARPKPSARWGSVTTLYFAANESPINGPWLFLNSSQSRKIVNHIAVMTEISKKYSENGRTLISVNVLKPQITGTDFQKVRDELEVLFGSQTKEWRHLKNYEIPQALPLYLTSETNGSFFLTPSQQGALSRGLALV